MSSIFIGWLALQTLGAVAFVILAKKTSVLVDEKERPIRKPVSYPPIIQAPGNTPDEQVQLVRRIKAAS